MKQFMITLWKVWIIQEKVIYLLLLLHLPQVIVAVAVVN